MALELSVVGCLEEVPQVEWDALCAPNEPFLDHGFLLALEKSGSVGAEAGWVPFYLLVKDGEALVGGVPVYLKNHSYGEFVFDWVWADAYARHGLEYYPKLVVAAPMTPATGNRFLINREGREGEVFDLLVDGLLALREKTGATGIHVLFLKENEALRLETRGFMTRLGHQFHWKNAEYENFSAFEEQLKQKRRKELRRERRQVADQSIDFLVLQGEDTKPWMKKMYWFYRDTCAKKGGYPYLSPKFFDLLPDFMGDRVLLFLAKKQEEILAGSLSFLKGKNLYGRYWGCGEEIPSLHFETCYYQGIQYAISNQLELFEAGAQGEHKLSRGFMPQLTYSSHFLAEKGFMAPIEDFLKKEKARVLQQMAWYEDRGPFKTAE